MTGIERLQRTGITRRSNGERGFKYQRADGKKVTRDELLRIKSLKIPPAWTEVSINPSPKGKLQAVGKDKAGRWQYIYHENHTRAQANKKYLRLANFMEDLPKMRATIARELRQPGLGREKVLACVMRVLSSCFLRPGSEVYASENGSYGIATLRPQHVTVRGDLIRFDFPGKSGVRQSRELRDRRVARVLRNLLKYRSEVFKYQIETGEFVDIKRRHINEYIKEVMGESFSAKDFRTWAGTLVCACALARGGTDGLEKASVRKRKIREAIKMTARTLGNTPAVCRSSYICPGVIENFEKGRTIKRFFTSPEVLMAYRGTKLHPAERALLRLLK
jgi:DNA topoisomerase I